jgi:hypothetical protein
VDRRRPIDRAIVGVSAIALIALCVGCGGPVLGAAAPAPSSGGFTAPIVVPADDTPPGWTNLDSPWLGYSVAIPRDWAFTGHVAPGVSRSPHDVFAGPVEGSDTTATLVLGRCATGDPTVGDAGSERVSVDGSPFRVAEVTADEPGRTILRATATRGGATWYLMASIGDDVASRDFFRKVLATFHFPDAGFVEPVAAGPHRA